MTTDEIKEQILRMEGFSDGIKQGASLLAQWMVSKLQAEQAQIQEPPKTDFPK